MMVKKIIMTDPGMCVTHPVSNAGLLTCAIVVVLQVVTPAVCVWIKHGV